MKNKNCIFHVPYYIDPKWPSGSNIRPINLIEAFKHNGYDVYVVSGYGEERKKNIEDIKRKIKEGIKFDFLYSESSTEPTLLTEKNHIPKFPLLDFAFMKFCKNNNIPIGLFYRDIYWQFEVYDKQVKFLKRIVAKLFYRYDLKKYNKLLDVFYLPSMSMMKYIPVKFNDKVKVKELPPAIDEVFKEEHQYHGRYINLFYVGGIGALYNIKDIFELAFKKDYIKLVVCCRENEWKSNKSQYEQYLNDRIEIIHKSGDELDSYFKNADIFSLYFEPIEYRKFAMPVKLFEYLAYKKPMVSTKNTATGDFIDKNSIGWTATYGSKDLEDIFESIYNNKEEYNKKILNIEAIVDKNTWDARASAVARDLINKL